MTNVYTLQFNGRTVEFTESEMGVIFEAMEEARWSSDGENESSDLIHSAMSKLMEVSQ
jgi:hypothetical protein